MPIDSNHSPSPTKEALQKIIAAKSVEKHLEDIGNYHYDKKIFYREDNQLFLAKKCLLVEGPNDKYGLPILAKTLSKDVGGCTVISCNGKEKIKHYKTLCEAFGISAFVVFDEDNKPVNEGENALLIQLCGNDRYSFKSSFEEILARKLNISERKILNEIENIMVENVPEEIVNCIDAIVNWLT